MSGTYSFLFSNLKKIRFRFWWKKPPKKRPNTLKRVLGTFFTTRGWCALAWGQVFHFVQALVTCWHTSLREKLVNSFSTQARKSLMHSRTKTQYVSTFTPSVLFAPRLASLSSSSVHVWRTYSPLPPLNTHYLTHLCTFSPTTTPCSKMFVPHIFCAFITRLITRFLPF